MTTPYISWLGHGGVDIAPPGVLTDVKGTMFAFDADCAAMQKLADTLLNPAGMGKVRYQAVLPVGMVSFLDAARCTSSTDVIGWLPGRECALWVPLLEFLQGRALPRLVFWAPYIFINYTMGMVIGREIWGWPKVMADIAVAGDSPADPRYRCLTTYFPTLSADTRGVTGMLFQVVGDIGPQATPAAQWTSGGAAAAAVIDALLGGVPTPVRAALLRQPQVPSVALKQFRDAGAVDTACYQAICDSPVGVTKFAGAGFLPGQFTLDITTCESHSITPDFFGHAADPGGTRVPIKFAMWVNADLSVLDGGNIVIAA